MVLPFEFSVKTALPTTVVYAQRVSGKLSNPHHSHSISTANVLQIYIKINKHIHTV